MIGSMLGRYHILEELGAGGMGVVYRARDRSLGREVAVKVLPAAFSGDPERMARFQREAKVLASLSHPNIASIHSLEEEDGVNFLVLELVPGATLSDLIRSGQLSLERALQLASQVAAALEAAHEQGIIHRDLKPANVKITADGKAKVLDFGLAKATGLEGSETDETKSTTITAPGTTMAGAILGTAAYMSPEQARGLPLDRRTDIWSFGCLLFESLTGQQTFEGRTISDCIANIIRGEPDWRNLPAETPRVVRDLLRRCLVKDPHHRLRDIGDARILLDEAIEEKSWIGPAGAEASGPEGAAAPAARPRHPLLRFLPWGVAAVALVAAGLGWFLRPESGTSVSSTVVSRADLMLPPAPPPLWPARGPALSPGGGWMIFPVNEGQVVRLYRRSLITSETEPVPGTEGVVDYFFREDRGADRESTDPGRVRIAFTALPDRHLRETSLEGGDATVVVAEPVRTGATWGPDGSIVYRLDEDQTGGHLWRLETAGNASRDPVILTGPDLQRGEVELTWPRVLPDGEHLLVTVRTRNGFQVAAHSLVTGQRTTLVEEGSSGIWTGDAVLYLDRDGLMVQPVDPATMEPSGSPKPVTDGVASTDGGAHGLFDAGRTGSLVYVEADDGGAAVARPGIAPIRGGEPSALPLEGAWLTPRIAQPSGRIALTSWGGDGFSVGVLDERYAYRGLTSPGSAFHPVWSPDGGLLVYSSRESGSWDILTVSTEGNQAARTLVGGATQDVASDWSRDGRYLLFTRYASASSPAGGDLWILPMAGERIPEPLLATPAGEANARFSPDGRWIAYVSDDSGRPEVYVRPFPASDRRYPVSAGGGTEPVWSPDGSRIHYRNGDRILTASVEVWDTTSIDIRPAGEAATEPLVNLPGSPGSFDALPDGNRLLVVRRAATASPGASAARILLDWRAAAGLPSRAAR